jgi:hypothetical protein
LRFAVPRRSECSLSWSRSITPMLLSQQTGFSRRVMRPTPYLPGPRGEGGGARLIGVAHIWPEKPRVCSVCIRNQGAPKFLPPTLSRTSVMQMFDSLRRRAVWSCRAKNLEADSWELSEALRSWHPK